MCGTKTPKLAALTNHTCWGNWQRQRRIFMMKILPSNASKMKEEKANKEEEWDGGIFLRFLQRAVKCPVNNVTYSKAYYIILNKVTYDMERRPRVRIGMPLILCGLFAEFNFKSNGIMRWHKRSRRVETTEELLSLWFERVYLISFIVCTVNGTFFHELSWKNDDDGKYVEWIISRAK